MMIDNKSIATGEDKIRNNTQEYVLGFVLSGSTTSSSRIQLTEKGENYAFEGMLVIIKSKKRATEYLGRIDSIVPINEFYQAGDPWSQARREGKSLDIIEKLGRRYVIAEIALLGVLGNRGLSDIRYPPEPGDICYTIPDIEHKQYAERIFGISRDESGYIWYGNILGYKNLPLPLNVENITMHMGIFGITGAGKSYGVGYLIEQLARIPYKKGDKIKYLALPTIVIDANGDYLDYYEAYIHGKKIGEYGHVYKFVFKGARHRGPGTREISIDLDVFDARELAEFIISYKTAGKALNELQVAGLELALKDLSDSYTFTELFTTKYRQLEQTLDSYDNSVIHHSTKAAIKSALAKFRSDIVKNLISETPSLTEKFVDEITTTPSLVLFDFSSDGAPGVSLLEKQLVIAYLARVLFQKFTKYKTKGEDRYLLLTIEEAQNYVPNTSNYPINATLTRDILSKIATQGRKFGLCLGLISQRPAFVDPVVVSMINTYIIHRVSPDDATYIRKIMGGLPKSLENRLTTLERGKAIVVGQMSPLGYPVLVEVGKREITHKMGKTNLVERLYELSNRK